MRRIRAGLTALALTLFLAVGWVALSQPPPPPHWSR
jgi:hypothetical protein